MLWELFSGSTQSYFLVAHSLLNGGYYLCLQLREVKGKLMNFENKGARLGQRHLGSYSCEGEGRCSRLKYDNWGTMEGRERASTPI
jgi:hypothetical protein